LALGSGSGGVRKKGERGSGSSGGGVSLAEPPQAVRSTAAETQQVRRRNERICVVVDFQI
jgi:hypothetical protein